MYTNDHRHVVPLFPDVKSNLKIFKICISYFFYLISCLSSHLDLYLCIHLGGLKYVSVNHGHAMKIKDTYNSANL